MKNKLLFLFFLVVPIGVLFRNWFFFGLISSGDFSYLFNETIERIHVFPYLWDTSFGKGLGGNISFILPLNTYYYISAFLLQKFFGFDWVIIERLVWFWPYLVLSIFSSTYAFRRIFPKNPFWFVSAIIFVSNTYALMLVGGGQLGVAMGYAISPLVILYFIHEIPNARKYTLLRAELLAGLLLAFQVMFDPRMAYISMLAVGVFFLLHINTMFRGNGLRMIIIPVSIAILLHMFWLLPLAMGGSNPIAGLGSAYSSASAVKYFSFADFSHTFSMLHPNWPENIFGKSSFVQPEFLGIPFLAFMSLLFMRGMMKEKYQQSMLKFFATLGIIGAFLAKGANPLFGEVYLWLFEHVPGFIMFRDPSKFYLLVALSYMVLIPVTLDQIRIWIERHFKYGRTIMGSVTITYIFIILSFFSYWVVLHRQMVMGKLGGTFVSQEVPKEYIQLKDYLLRDESFFRVLWVPIRSRYGYSDDDRLATSLDTLSIAGPSSFISWIKDSKNDQQLRRFAVKYIVVPTDVKGELFVTDRKYDDPLRQSVIAALDDTKRFKLLQVADNIAVYKIPESYGHAYFVDQPNSSVSIQRSNVTRYNMSIPKRDMDARLVFSESYSPFWKLFVMGTEIRPTKTIDGLQEYRIPASVYGIGTLRYDLQDNVATGLWIGVVSLVVIGIVLWRFR